jgi:anaerobic selenocysteine-containing dehydrogenase
MYTGLEYTKSGVQNIRAVMVLWALAGQLDVEGGRCFLRRENRFPLPVNRQIATPGFEKSIGKGHFPVYAHFCGGEPHANLLPKSIIDGDPYRIRAMIIQGASILTSWPASHVWKKALETLEFLVCIDLQLTQDAAYADIVLPATTAFEQESYCYYGTCLRLREKMIDPVGEAKRLPVPADPGRTPELHPERIRIYDGRSATCSETYSPKRCRSHGIPQMGKRNAPSGRKTRL